MTTLDNSLSSHCTESFSSLCRQARQQRDPQRLIDKLNDVIIPSLVDVLIESWHFVAIDSSERSVASRTKVLLLESWKSTAQQEITFIVKFVKLLEQTNEQLQKLSALPSRDVCQRKSFESTRLCLRRLSTKTEAEQKGTSKSFPSLGRIRRSSNRQFNELNDSKLNIMGMTEGRKRQKDSRHWSPCNLLFLPTFSKGLIPVPLWGSQRELFIQKDQIRGWNGCVESHCRWKPSSNVEPSEGPQERENRNVWQKYCVIYFVISSLSGDLRLRGSVEDEGKKEEFKNGGRHAAFQPSRSLHE